MFINDDGLIYKKNKKWVELTGPSYTSMLKMGDDLLAGGASTGTIWKIMREGVYNDDGVAIAASWVSKDFMFKPNVEDWSTGEKVLNEIWVDAASVSGSTLTVGYAVNKASSFSTATLYLGTSVTTILRRAVFSATWALGKYFAIKFANAQNDTYFRVNAYTLYGRGKPRPND